MRCLLKFYRFLEQGYRRRVFFPLFLLSTSGFLPTVYLRASAPAPVPPDSVVQVTPATNPAGTILLPSPVPLDSTGLTGAPARALSDSLEVIPDSAIAQRHSPKKAAWRAAVLPGWGQVYNRKYWKLPIVYGGLGGLSYWVYFNADQHRFYRQAFEAKTDEDPSTVDPLPLVSESAILQTKEYYRRQLDASVLFTVGFYGLQIVDAVVDAHLFDFDVSRDLSLHWSPMPSFGVSNRGFALAAGAGLHFSLSYK